MCALSAATVTACGLATSLTTLTLARIAAGATAAWIIPLGMAFIGDVVPYEKRQQVLGRYLSGQITGQLFGQAASGVIGDFLGWRAAFFIHAAIFAFAAAALFREMRVNPMTQPPVRKDAFAYSFAENYRIVLTNGWARNIILAAFLEGALMFGAFAYVGADLRLRFGVSFSLVGMTVGAFAIGGLIYAGTVKQLVARFGQSGLIICGGILLGLSYLSLALAQTWWVAPVAVMSIGLGFYMLHNTLQTNATQMSPDARGTAVALFSAALYIGQTAGVAFSAPVIDRIGAPPIFLASAILLPALALWFAGRLKNR
jgi:predicted MFS family arabinose efflux permease